MDSKPTRKSIDDQVSVEHLAANARVRTNEPIRHTFSADKLGEMKEEYFEMSRKLSARIELASEVKAIIEKDPDPLDQIGYALEQADQSKLGTVDTKTLKVKTKALMDKINAGFEFVDTDLYGYDYQDVSRMAFYDEQGLFVYDRPLTGPEKQTSIITQIKKAS